MKTYKEKLIQIEKSIGVQFPDQSITQPTYEDALTLATKAHFGQFRKYNVLPFITHPEAVAAKFDTQTFKIVAVLHDIIEDTEITISDLIYLNYSNEIIQAIKAITKERNEPYLEYILKVQTNPIGTAVKIQDILHNLSTLPALRQTKDKINKYHLAIHILTNGI